MQENGICKTLKPNKYSFLSKGWFFAYYFKQDSEKHDLCSRSIFRVKKNQPYIINWIDVVVNNLPEENFDYILRVLGSDELLATYMSPMDGLGHSLSKN